MENLLRKNLDRDCVRNEINDFSIQLQQHRVAFTAYDFFEMNNALLSGFVGAITTYLIILVQCYRPDNSNMQLN
ncbi:putative gustatory receptor 2a [Monomorium pharaonis]|uniref:putative gustatory receptor 2a n=1 Tax=Monomorium pharaonis TaxID=307658 RepID=UPI001747C3CE|nr:putative gustatory receptor 2a [Monomorium pharaonis]